MPDIMMVVVPMPTPSQIAPLSKDEKKNKNNNCSSTLKNYNNKQTYPV